MDGKKERPKPSKFSVSAANTMHVMEVLQITATPGNEKYTLQHLIKLLLKRNDMERLPVLVDLYFKLHPAAVEIQLSKFYFWYKDNSLSEEDMIVYDVYMINVSRYGVHDVSPAPFAENGTALLMWLVEFVGEDSGNDLIETLHQYFKWVLPEVVKFSRPLLQTPRSLLQGYGRNVFLGEVEKNGGKNAFIQPSVIDVRKNKIERTKLDAITKYRQRLLEKGDIKGYDKLGQDVAERGIEEVYKDLPV